MPTHSMLARLEELQFPRCLSKGELLATREQGESERACLEKDLGNAQPGEVLGINVGRVRFINYSFSDECFGKLCSRLQSGEYPDRFAVLVAPREDMENRLQDISMALKNRKLAMLWLSCPDDPEGDVVGELSENLKQTLRAVRPGDTNEVLAEKLNIKLTACINRTDKLTKMRLLRKKLHAGEYGYKQYEFAPIVTISD